MDSKGVGPHHQEFNSLGDERVQYVSMIPVQQLISR
jgi:hypothetical protein